MDEEAQPRLRPTERERLPGGFRAATVTIRSNELTDTRSYSVLEVANGKFRAVAEGKWATAGQPIGPLVK